MHWPGQLVPKELAADDLLPNLGLCLAQKNTLQLTLFQDVTPVQDAKGLIDRRVERSDPPRVFEG